MILVIITSAIFLYEKIQQETNLNYDQLYLVRSHITMSDQFCFLIHYNLCSTLFEEPFIFHILMIDPIHFLSDCEWPSPPINLLRRSQGALPQKKKRFSLFGRKHTLIHSFRYFCLFQQISWLNLDKSVPHQFFPIFF